MQKGSVPNCSFFVRVYFVVKILCSIFTTILKLDVLMRKFYTLAVIGLISLQAVAQAPEYCLENDAAHRYLTEVVYDSNDYTYTKITDYCDPKPYQYYKYDGYRKDQPQPVPLWFTSPLDTVGTLYVSESEDYEGAWTYTLAKGTQSFDVYNLIPGKFYLWKVECANQLGEIGVVQQGAFKTTGTLRMLKIDNVFNVRDMGGWIGQYHQVRKADSRFTS